jgi:hypothetical protein
MARLPVRARKAGEPELELARPADPGDSSDSSSSSGPVRTAPRKAAGPALLVPDPASVREMLGGRPELLEAGLRVHGDAQGKPIGVDFSTEVGEVDLLARDAAGSYVVVMVAAQGQGEDFIAEGLERIGWIRKHIVTGSERRVASC